MLMLMTAPAAAAGETNGKSCNLNNCLQNVMFPNCTQQGDDTWDYTVIGDHEILVVGASWSVARMSSWWGWWSRRRSQMLNDLCRVHGVVCG
jgi:hypothetical protein